MVILLAYVRSSELFYNEFDDSVGESTSSDSKLELGEANPHEIGVPRGLIFPSGST